MQYETYLAHYGVKGMKWGVRRYQPYPDGVKGRKKGQPKPPNAVSTYLRKTKANSASEIYKRSKTMSDEELKAANKRYQLEQNYRQNAMNDARASRSFAETVLRQSGNIFVKAAIGAAAGAAGAYVGKTIYDSVKGVRMSDVKAWVNGAQSAAAAVPVNINWARYMKDLRG